MAALSNDWEEVARCLRLANCPLNSLASIMEISFSEEEAEFSTNDQRIEHGAMFVLGFIGGTIPFSNDLMKFLGGCTCAGFAGLGMYMAGEQPSGFGEGVYNTNGHASPEDLREQSVVSVESL